MATKRVPPGRRVQLHRACSKLGWGSRTQAVAWIRDGTVLVDGRVVTDPLTWVDLDRQHITRTGEQSSAAMGAALSPAAAVDNLSDVQTGGRRKHATPPGLVGLGAPTQPRSPTDRLVLALYKPVGVVTTRRDERGRRTVYDLVPPGVPWIFPAGRLDADSEGLLIMTSDSALAVRLTEPAAHVPKTYHVTIRGLPALETLERLRRGIRLLGRRTKPVQIRVIRQNRQSTLVEMILEEGRNRQIRRMWHAVGHRVGRLVRVAIGEYRLGNMKPGESQMLSSEDVERLTHANKT